MKVLTQTFETGLIRRVADIPNRNEVRKNTCLSSTLKNDVPG